MNDAVNHPAHYTDGKIEVIDFIEDKKLPYHLGNAVKYICRAGKKDPDKKMIDLKIDDEVYVHGYVDEIRKDTVIIRNGGGYFGTELSEIVKAPDRPKVEWITIYEGNGWNEWTNLICPLCGEKFEKVGYPEKYKLCPNCGADMRGEDDE